MPRKPQAFDERGFSPVLSLLNPVSLLPSAPPLLAVRLHCTGNTPLPREWTTVHFTPAASAERLVPIIVGAEMLDR